VTDLDAPTVLRAGGWDPRFAVVRAVATLGDHAAAVIDANRDGADINIEHYLRGPDGGWTELSSSGGPGGGSAWSEGVRATYWEEEGGWLLTLTSEAAVD
jgi:hypothetical protein